MIHKHRYGLLRSHPDKTKRAHKFSLVHGTRIPATLPLFTSNACYNSPVRDQGTTGCCTGEAHVAALEYLAIKAGDLPTPLSPLFVYSIARILEGTLSQDAGAEPADVIQALTTEGVCRESMWPFDPDMVSVIPPTGCYTEAAGHKVTASQVLESLDDMKACLAMGLGFTFGIECFPSMETDEVNESGDIPMPGMWERISGQSLGGHDLFAFDFDDRIGMFLLKNSWGKLWGRNGFGRIPYAYLQNPRLAYDFHCIQADESYTFANGNPAGSV